MSCFPLWIKTCAITILIFASQATVFRDVVLHFIDLLRFPDELSWSFFDKHVRSTTIIATMFIFSVAVSKLSLLLVISKQPLNMTDLYNVLTGFFLSVWLSFKKKVVPINAIQKSARIVLMKNTFLQEIVEQVMLET